MSTETAAKIALENNLFIAAALAKRSQRRRTEILKQKRYICQLIRGIKMRRGSAKLKC